MSALRIFAGMTLLLGLGAAFAGSPYRDDRNDSRGPRVTAVELAAWIRDRRPGLRVLDLRTETEFNAYQIPTAEHVPLDAVARLRATPGDTLVVYAGDTATAEKAAARLRAAGHSQVLVLRGGANAWIDDVMNPARSTEVTRYFGGTARPAGTVRTVRRGC
jgi:rhodanese-related sulfurtransferase